MIIDDQEISKIIHKRKEGENSRDSGAARLKLAGPASRIWAKLKSTWLGSMLFSTSESLFVKLSRNLFLLFLLVAAIPSLLQALIANHESSRMVEQEFKSSMVWRMRHVQTGVDDFLTDHLRALQFLFDTYPLAAFNDQAKLHRIFSKFKEQFPNFTFVDLGLIDSSGNQNTYTGPYDLVDVNYADEPWFYEVVVRGSYISDIFLGHRNSPHLLIAVKSPLSDTGDFSILRTTINPEAFEKMLASMNCLHEDDTFLVNKDGILQSPSRFHGGTLSKYFMQLPLAHHEIIFTENRNARNEKEVIVYTGMEIKDWILVFMQPLALKERDLRALQFWMAGVLVLCFGGVFFLAIWITRNFVGRLKAAEQEHEALLHKIEHTNKLALIGRLAAGVAHEINNPLAIINEKAGLIKDLSEMSNDFAHKHRFMELVEAIHATVVRCRTITRRLLGFARQIDVMHEVCDINSLIREVLGFLEKEAFHRSIKISMNLQEDLPTIESDRGQLQQVFLNIVNNAVHAVDDGGKIGITTWFNKEKMVAVKISDNGCGIPQDKLKRIFEPFYTTKSRDKGTGLGLSITYGIINKLGGKVSVESEVNKGTIFTIELPMRCE